MWLIFGSSAMFRTFSDLRFVFRRLSSQFRTTRNSIWVIIGPRLVNIVLVATNVVRVACVGYSVCMRVNEGLLRSLRPNFV
jgi:hypothetical protein